MNAQFLHIYVILDYKHYTFGVALIELCLKGASYSKSRFNQSFAVRRDID